MICINVHVYIDMDLLNFHWANLPFFNPSIANRQPLPPKPPRAPGCPGDVTTPRCSYPLERRWDPSGTKKKAWKITKKWRFTAGKISYRWWIFQQHLHLFIDFPLLLIICSHIFPITTSILHGDLPILIGGSSSLELCNPRHFLSSRFIFVQVTNGIPSS